MNPYHDETGRFCSKDEMQNSIATLMSQGNTQAALELTAELHKIETASRKKNFFSNPFSIFTRKQELKPTPTVQPVKKEPEPVEEVAVPIPEYETFPVHSITPENTHENSYLDYGFTDSTRESLFASTTPYRIEEHAHLYSEITHSEKAALQKYTDESYAPINSALTNGIAEPVNPGNPKSPWFDEYDGDYDVHTIPLHIEELDSALSKAPNVYKTVYRGIMSRVSPELGSIIDNERYMSTSLNPQTAGSFSYRMLYEIKTPYGTCLNSVANNYGESEVLLPRNTRYAVVGVREVEVPGAPYTIVQLVAVGKDNKPLTPNDIIKPPQPVVLEEEFPWDEGED